MSELKRTEVRHRMLAEVAAGNVAAIKDLGWHWGDREAAMSRSEKAALSEFALAECARVVPDRLSASIWQRVEATDMGRGLLAAWNDQYGEVQP